MTGLTTNTPTLQDLCPQLWAEHLAAIECAAQDKTATESTAVLAALRDGTCTVDPAANATHLTVSAFITHPKTGEIATLWHPRRQKWSQPGGHIDPGDTSLIFTAAREVAEEVGLTDIQWSPYWWGRHFQLTGTAWKRGCTVHYDAAVHGIANTHTLTSPENHRVQWTSLAEGLKTSWQPTDVSAVTYCLATATQ